MRPALKNVTDAIRQLSKVTDNALKAHDEGKPPTNDAQKQYIMALGADQNPGDPSAAYWINFFGRPTPFVTGPEKSARINNTAVVFVHHYKVKRGYYHADFSLITTTPKDYGRGELTKVYVEWLQDCIRKKPFNYLWSHRRWKWEFREEYKKLLI